MEEPSLRTSRRAIGGAIAAALVLGGGGFLLGRATAPDRDPAPEEVAGPIVSLPIPVWEGPLARPDLISLAALAADTTATGLAPDDELVESEGRRFEIRLPFGCGGPAADDASTGWSYDEASETLRVFVTPRQWSPETWLQPAAGTEKIESIEGFWIARPWTSSEACPAKPPEPRPTDDATGDGTEDRADTSAPESEEGAEPASEARPAPQPTLAIGQVYTTESPRSGRREGESFEAVARVAADDLDTSQGFRLRISGRLTNAAGPAPAVCRQEGPAQRPVCLVTAAMDEVTIENPATGETLATWTLGQRGTSRTN